MPRCYCGVTFPVPMLKPRYTWTESQFTISPPRRAASSIASFDFPAAVGPAITTRG